MTLLLRLGSVFLLVPVASLSQEAASTPGVPISTLSVSTRLVYVDVIVRDPAGHVVRDLTQQDSTVLEDGKPQPISFFLPHIYEGNAAHPPATHAASDPKLEFSNVAPEGASDTTTVLLFDLLNTPAEDQLYAREQMLKFLRALPPGQHVALFVLAERLRMMQGFTGSPALLTAAATMLNPKDFGHIFSEIAAKQEAEAAEELERQSKNGHGGSGTGMQLGQTEPEPDRNIRTPITLSALAELAGAMSGYPGRKSLFWLSESFPISLNTSQNLFGQALQTDARKTANFLSNAQIAIYPMSVVGLDTDPYDPALRDKPDEKTEYWRQMSRRGVLKDQMNNLAQQTGGEAIVANNDLAGALRHSIEDGSNYYTLAYVPQNKNWNGKFRKIRVELAKKEDSVIYRRGYFATPDMPAANPQQELIAALSPETPDATMLRLKSKVDLPVAAHAAVVVTSYVDARDVNFTTETDGHKRAKLLLLLVAFDGDGKPAQTTDKLSLDLDPARYQSVLASGIGFQQTLALKPGNYQLRLGVSDISGHRIGTLSMSVNVPDMR